MDQYCLFNLEYVVLNSGTFSSNNVYTYNVPVDGTNVTSVDTGVSFAGFSSQVTQSLNFRIN
jgi:hypothetical protein